MRQMYVRLFPLLVLTTALGAQDLSKILSDISKQNDRNAKVTALRFVCVPADCRVRPFESIPIQVMVDGELTAKDGTVKKGRLRRAPGTVRVVTKDGGAVSKPFKFQGKDAGGYVEATSAIGSIFGQVSGDFTVFDSVLYTAPEKPGVYTLDCDTEGVRAEMKVTVDAAAPATRADEQFTFKAEDKSQEKFRGLAEHWAPVFAQETWWQPKSDFVARFDYDNDLVGDNNWDNLEKGSSQAYIYYAAVETPSHWFLIYNAFHPRDYSDKCLLGSCHENDNEGAILCVQRDGSEFGKLMAMETLAHNNLYSYVTDSAVTGGVHSIEGKIELRDGSHPLIFIESGGHGMFAGNDSKHARYTSSNDSFGGGTGVTYVYKGVAERPRHANDRNVGYELLPILTHWWAHAGNDQERMFDEFGPYEPWGGRPGIKQARVGKTFLGRKESANKAKPFWGWHDNKTLNGKVLNAGQWGLDPAYAFSKNLTFSGARAIALDYTYNPYLGIGGETVSAAAPGAAQVAAQPAPAANTAPATEPAPAAGGTPLLPAIGTAASEGWVEVSATVDGTVIFHAFGQSVAPEVLSGQNVANQKTQFSGPVPEDAALTWSVEKKSGRGKVELSEKPSDANGYTLKVRVEDPARGSDNYVFRVKWKKS